MSAPNSFVGVLYGISFFTGAWYGSKKNREFKAEAKNALIHDIQNKINAVKEQSFNDGAESVRASLRPQVDGEGFKDEIQQLLADVIGADLVRQLSA
ncbi:hypothetical protein DFA_11291 [Cavenderia fasciculata]|uniref:Uncharacterized protein n=1 Tax=Cavenderia fasciculata TaxID=261658 RepID=F4QC43_CACFS|nr:uncharacterized protein DFA_11291 [Cavenderia fasciculata]EGG13530.1 hypothetical protein DFA_11291 [Cavenderia fasciculata]|eukprot:XP_004350234.1 hypothetical protein DFA_11291 [Cavenderia fasciculata]